MLYHGYRASFREILRVTLDDPEDHTSIAEPYLKARVGGQIFIITRREKNSYKIYNIAVAFGLNYLKILAAAMGTYLLAGYCGISTMVAFETFNDPILLWLCHIGTSTFSQNVGSDSGACPPNIESESCLRIPFRVFPFPITTKDPCDFT
jgi:hypothetical protein